MRDDKWRIKQEQKGSYSFACSLNSYYSLVVIFIWFLCFLIYWNKLLNWWYLKETRWRNWWKGAEGMPSSLLPYSTTHKVSSDSSKQHASLEDFFSLFFVVYSLFVFLARQLLFLFCIYNFFLFILHKKKKSCRSLALKMHILLLTQIIDNWNFLFFLLPLCYLDQLVVLFASVVQ